MPDWIDNLNLPPNVKSAATIIAVIVAATLFASGQATRVLTAATEAKEEAGAAAKSSAETAKEVDKQNNRISKLEEALVRIDKDRTERKATEAELKKDLRMLQVKIANMDGNQTAQNAAILRALQRLETKVDSK